MNSTAYAPRKALIANISWFETSSRAIYVPCKHRYIVRVIRLMQFLKWTLPRLTRLTLNKCKFRARPLNKTRIAQLFVYRFFRVCSRWIGAIIVAHIRRNAFRDVERNAQREMIVCRVFAQSMSTFGALCAPKWWHSWCRVDGDALERQMCPRFASFALQ